MRLLNLFLCLSAVGVAQCFQPNAKFSTRRQVVGLPKGGDQLQVPTPANRSPLFFKPLPATAAEGAPEEPWTKPRLHNNPLVRSAVVLSALMLAGRSAPFSKLNSTLAGSVHLLSFATWFGTVFYTTFIAGITMFKALPRQTFGKLQSKLFPKYFSLCSLSIVLQVSSL